MQIPCNMNTSFINISTIWAVLYVDLTSMKWVTILNLSTTTMIEPFFFYDMGSPVMKSSVIISHFHSGMDSG